MAYFLGVDAGGSHTRARLVGADGRVLGHGEAGPANARIGIAALKAVLDDCCGQAIDEARLDGAAIATVRAGIGIAGISRAGVRESLAELDFPFAAVRYDTDAAIANIGAHHGRDGAILVIGTGSVAYVRLNGQSFHIGGYGFPISDEGSGAALGLSAMRHALRALDGRTLRTALSDAVNERFDHDTRRAVAWMDGAAPKDYAGFAPLVMDYADRGDPIALGIVEDAATHIERFVETVFDRGAPRLALAGGLAPRMRPWLRDRTVARLSPPLGDPLDGALILAGWTPPPAGSD